MANTTSTCLWLRLGNDTLEIEYDGDNRLTGRIRGQEICTLDLLLDEKDRYWLNGITTIDRYQKKGIGLAMLERAVYHLGEVYVAVDMPPQEDGNDTRHLSTEGAALVNSAVSKGILNRDWCFNPLIGPYEPDPW